MFSSKWPKNPTFFSQQFETMKKQTKKTNALRSNMTVNGTMTFAKNNDNLNIIDFNCTEMDVELDPYSGRFKVQVMHDGDVYITEMKKRKRNRPLFREDNSSLSLGFDGRYFFCFSLDAEEVEELPDKLVHQALLIAQKVVNGILYTNAEEVVE